MKSERSERQRGRPASEEERSDRGEEIPLPALDEDRVRGIGNISPFWQSNVLRIAFEKLGLKVGR